MSKDIETLIEKIRVKSDMPDSNYGRLFFGEVLKIICDHFAEPDAPGARSVCSEIRLLTEDEFAKIWTNKTWAKSTFKFLEREGLKIMKAIDPVSLIACTNALINSLEYAQTKEWRDAELMRCWPYYSDATKAVLDAAGVPYVD